MLHSAPYQSPNPNSNPIFDEQRWIIQIRKALEDEDDLDQESNSHASIFNVPKALLLTSPESYVPQLVALGPYHHSRPELYEMERHKLSAARRSRRNLPGIKLHDLVDQLCRAEHKVRACYHKFLNLNGETLAWMMAVDSCFVLEFLRVFVETGAPGQNSGLHDAILRDVVMLENQIPLFSVTKTMEFLSGSSDGADDQLHAMVIGFCREVSPFVITREYNDVNKINRCAHILEFLYNLTVPEFRESSEITMDSGGLSPNKAIPAKMGPLSLIKRLVFSKPVKFIITLPWKIISNLPGMIMLRQVEYFCFPQEIVNENDDDDEDNNNNNNSNDGRRLLMEEIAIPSVTELSNAGVKFTTTDLGIRGINFDVKTSTFQLPVLSIDVNTEVMMRNLVAYEACIGASRPLICARYTELMNGIVDGEEDAKILRENGIILNHLKSDQDVADLWNGMNRSIRLTKVPFLDTVIEDVNRYYSSRWRVKIGIFLKRYVYGSWQSMAFSATILLLFFVSLQTLCSVFGCPRFFFRRSRMN